MIKTFLLSALLFVSTQFLFSQTFVQYHGQLSVRGTKVVNRFGDTVSFAGPSLFWSNTYWGGEKYYNSDVVSWVNDDWNAPIIRASMGVNEGGGYLTSAQNKTANKYRVTDVVDAAIAEGMYVIIDWHCHTAEDYKNDAVAFFSEMAQKYKNYPNVMYEIYNEPLNVSWSQTIKPYANSVIAAIRQYDTKNIIIVGTPNWSQDVDVASESPISGYSNIAYTLHFYAGTHAQDLRNKAITAIENGICLIVTEWGTINANGDGDVATAELALWVDFMKEYKLTNCNWALNDKNEGASALKGGTSVSGFWDESDLTASGLVVKDLILNWEGNYVKELSSISTVENSSQVTISNKVISFKNLDIQGNIQVSIVTMQAVSLLQTSIGNSSETIDISNLSAGTYILTIQNGMKKESFKLVL